MLPSDVKTDRLYPGLISRNRYYQTQSNPYSCLFE